MPHSILGFELIQSKLGSSETRFVPFSSGLSVFYGLNGAGKTRLLDGIRGCFTGESRPTKVGLVVRVEKPTQSELDREADEIDESVQRSNLVRSLAEHYSSRSDHDVWAVDTASTGLSLGECDRIVDTFYLETMRDIDPSTPFYISPDKDDLSDLEKEVLADRILLLLPTGTAEKPAWSAWPLANRETPAVKAEIDRLQVGLSEVRRLNELREYSDSIGDTEKAGAAILAIARLSRLLDGSPLTLEADEWKNTLPDKTANSSLSSVETFVLCAKPMLPGDGYIDIEGHIDFGVDVLSAPYDVVDVTNRYIRYSLDMDADKRRQCSESQNCDHDGTRYPGPCFSFSEFEAVELAVKDEAKRLSEQVTETLENFLGDPPVAHLELATLDRRFTETPLLWKFAWKKGVHASSFSLEELSGAEQKWATFAVSYAAYWLERSLREGMHSVADKFSDPRQLLTILDEPESQIHRAAEAKVSSALSNYAVGPHHSIFAATHSPEILNAREARLFEVRRSTSSDWCGSTLANLRAADIADLQDLGMRPSDLLAFTRLFLLVEGEHDQVVLEAYFGARLNRAGVTILPLRGATKLPATVDSRVLFDFTDAHLVALVDNQDGSILTTAWQEALEVRNVAGVREAQEVILSRLIGREEEARFMREWLTAALIKGLQNRVTPYGLTAKDVIEYVPASGIVGQASDWAQLRSDHATDRENDLNTPRDFKRWLQVRKGAIITPDTLRSAIGLAAAPPLELERFVKFLEATASDSYG